MAYRVARLNHLFAAMLKMHSFQGAGCHLVDGPPHACITVLQAQHRVDDFAARKERLWFDRRASSKLEPENDDRLVKPSVRNDALHVGVDVLWPLGQGRESAGGRGGAIGPMRGPKANQAVRGAGRAAAAAATRSVTAEGRPGHGRAHGRGSSKAKLPCAFKCDSWLAGRCQAAPSVPGCRH